MKSKKLEYDLCHPVFEPIGYMKNVIPEWFKKIEKFSGGKLSIFPSTITVKSCAPFMDTFLTGYYMPLPVDLLVEQTINGPRITWNFFDLEYKETDFVIERDTGMVPTLPIPKGFHNNHFSWSTKQVLKVENGYSLLITHPLNRDDLPFRTLSGVVDTDNYHLPVQFPFHYISDSEGTSIIKKGTPLCQIIPFKRDNWEMETLEYDQEKNDKRRFEHSRQIIRSYKNQYWERKKFI